MWCWSGGTIGVPGRPQALVQALHACHRWGVDLLSSQEHLDTMTPPGEWMCTGMAALAPCERALIRARVNAGMARAKAQGQRLSRAPLAKALHARMAALYAQGLALHQIRMPLGMG